MEGRFAFRIWEILFTDPNLLLYFLLKIETPKVRWKLKFGFNYCLAVSILILSSLFPWKLKLRKLSEHWNSNLIFFWLFQFLIKNTVCNNRLLPFSVDLWLLRGWYNSGCNEDAVDGQRIATLISGRLARRQYTKRYEHILPTSLQSFRNSNRSAAPFTSIFI